MKTLLLFTAYVLSMGSVIGQFNEIQLETQFGAKNREVFEMMRFDGVQSNLLTFSGKKLKGKNYLLILKEYSNGILSRSDTIINSKASPYISEVMEDTLRFKFFFKTKNQNLVKMHIQAPRFTINKEYDVKKSIDEYALHDFNGGNKFIPIALGKCNYVLGYFLPYLRKGTDFKSYCDVSASPHKPEEWGDKLGLPNYFLVQILFQ